MVRSCRDAWLGFGKAWVELKHRRRLRLGSGKCKGKHKSTGKQTSWQSVIPPLIDSVEYYSYP